jgi:hypothetical protein
VSVPVIEHKLVKSTSSFKTQTICFWKFKRCARNLWDDKRNAPQFVWVGWISYGLMGHQMGLSKWLTISHGKFLFPPHISFLSQFSFLVLVKKLQNAFFYIFLSWIKTSKYVFQIFFEFELQKFQKTCSKVFIQRQN